MIGWPLELTDTLRWVYLVAALVAVLFGLRPRSRRWYWSLTDRVRLLLAAHMLFLGAVIISGLTYLAPVDLTLLRVIVFTGATLTTLLALLLQRPDGASPRPKSLWYRWWRDSDRVTDHKE